MNLRYLLTAAALALASVVYAQPMATVVPKDEKPPPVIKLPPEKPTNVAKYDPTAAKIRDLPYHVTLVKAPDAWAKNPAAKGEGVKVAVLDTGVQADHPGLHGQVKGLYDAIKRKEGTASDGHGHGTHCCGIVHSIVPKAELYAVKVLSDQGSGSTADIAHGIDYATNVIKADVISMSLGGPDKDPYQEPAIKRAIAAGVVVICAAGNDGPGENTEGYPGRLPDSVSVAACDSKRQLAGFSSRGPNVFTADPGVDVLSTLPGNQEGEMSGTSMATPCEAGKCASWIASNAVPRTKDRRDLFKAAVLKASPFQQRNDARGYGLYTLDKITGEVSTPKPPTPAPGEKVYTISISELQKQGYTAVHIDLGTAAPASTQPIPVASYPVPQPQPAPVFTGPGTVFEGYAPPPTVYQQMPTQCPGGQCYGGQCQPAPLFPVLRRVFR